MQRRRVLAASCGVLLGGCLRSEGESTGSDDSAGTATADQDGIAADEPTGTDAAETTGTDRDESAGSSVSVDRAMVQPGVVMMADDSIHVADDAGQYLLVNVAVGDDAPGPEAFELAFDGDVYEPILPRQFFYWPDGIYRSEDHHREDPGGWLVFGLPDAGDGSGAHLTWNGGEWRPPESVRARLEAPLPSFEVDFSAPDTVTEDDRPTLSLAVTNVGEIAGTQVLALNREGPRIAYAPVGEIVVACDPGETVTRELDAKSPYEAPEPRSVRYRLEVANGETRSRTIEPAANS